MQKIGMALVVLLGMAGSASADVITSEFYYWNFNNPSIVSPYATLTVTGDGAVNGVVTFDLVVDAPNDAGLNKLGINTLLNSADFTLGSVLVGDPAATLSKGSFQLDGFGRYDILFDNHEPGSSPPLTPQLTFTVNVLNGQTALASNFYELNNAANFPGHFYFAAELFPASGASGFIGADGVTTVATPEPASVFLLATGAVCGIGVWWRRRRQGVAAV